MIKQMKFTRELKSCGDEAAGGENRAGEKRGMMGAPGRTKVLWSSFGVALEPAVTWSPLRIRYQGLICHHEISMNTAKEA
jgi:hypothetical protein